MFKVDKSRTKKRPIINFPAPHHVHHFLALLQLPLRTLDEARLRPHGVVVSGARERSAQLGDLARGLVDRHHVAGAHLKITGQKNRQGGTDVWSITAVAFATWSSFDKMVDI